MNFVLVYQLTVYVYSLQGSLLFVLTRTRLNYGAAHVIIQPETQTIISPNAADTDISVLNGCKTVTAAWNKVYNHQVIIMQPLEAKYPQISASPLVVSHSFNSYPQQTLFLM